MALQEMLQNLGGFQSLAANAQRMQQVEQQQTATKEASDLLRTFYKSQQEGKPDYNSLNEAILRSPDLAQNVLSGIGLQDKQRQQKAASDVVTLYQSLGNKDAFNRAAAVRVNDIMASGGDPKDTLELVRVYNERGPEAAAMSLKQVGAALVNQGLIRPELVGFGGGAEPMTEFQKASTDLRRQELESNKALKAAEFKMKALQAQIAKENNDLKRQEMELKLQETQADIAKKQQDLEAVNKKKEAGNVMLADTYKVAKELAGAENLSDIVGTIELNLPTISGASQDLINKASRLQSLLTADNLSLMSGILTDKDIAFLTNIASGLNVTEGGIRGSTEGVKKRLGEIVKRIESSAKAKGVSLEDNDRDEQDIMAEYGL